MQKFKTAFTALGNRLKRPPLRNILILVVAVTLFQLLTEGSVSWPGKLTDSLREYATRPDAAWRKASDKIEDLGAAREGSPLPDFDFTGRVVRVADGDTISVLDRNNTQHKIRLHGIDTPERDQAHGRAAREALSGLVAGKTVGVVALGKDSYGRTDGIVYLDEKDINLAMVASGHAWWYRYYAPNDRLLERTEQQAREGKRGLWADPDPVPPWDWRRQQRYSR